MSKKDYVAIAAAVRSHLEPAKTRIGSDGYAAIVCLALSLADTFAADNPRFDRSRFYAACGIGEQ